MKNTTQSGKKIYFQLFFVALFSSCCLYFDQKLIIVPMICFFSVILSEKIFRLKILLAIFYFIFSLPYIYMIIWWGGLLPEGDMVKRQIGNQLYFGHIGYTVTIIAFYLLPLLFFKEKKIFVLFKDFFKEKNNYFLISLFGFYLIYLLFFYNFNDAVLGKGFIHKISIVSFDDEYMRKIFTYFSFFVSWIIILIFLDKNIKNSLIILFFLILSLVIRPVLQEYFDPLILLLAFTFFGSKIIFNYKNSTFLYLYLSTLMIGANIYYINLLK